VCPHKRCQVFFCTANERNINYCLCEANAHNTIWGSTNTKIKGEQIFELINSESLLILNKGSEPTFVNSVRKEVLDVTLAFLDLK
jgi:hypothetical protein